MNQRRKLADLPGAAEVVHDCLGGGAGSNPGRIDGPCELVRIGRERESGETRRGHHRHRRLLIRDLDDKNI